MFVILSINDKQCVPPSNSKMKACEVYDDKGEVFRVYDDQIKLDHSQENMLVLAPPQLWILKKKSLEGGKQGKF